MQDEEVESTASSMADAVSTRKSHASRWPNVAGLCFSEGRVVEGGMLGDCEGEGNRTWRCSARGPLMYPENKRCNCADGFERGVQAWARAKADEMKAQGNGGGRGGGGGWDGKMSEGHPSFMDGRGKLMDSRSKRLMAIQASPTTRSGYGVVKKTFPESGNTYEGEMSDGKYHGQGQLLYRDGRRYNGGWHEGVMHGKGIFHFANGDGALCLSLRILTLSICICRAVCL